MTGALPLKQSTERKKILSLDTAQSPYYLLIWADIKPLDVAQTTYYSSYGAVIKPSTIQHFGNK